jgi:hypothetical protein
VKHLDRRDVMNEGQLMKLDGAGSEHEDKKCR